MMIWEELTVTELKSFICIVSPEGRRQDKVDRRRRRRMIGKGKEQKNKNKEEKVDWRKLQTDRAKKGRSILEKE